MKHQKENYFKSKFVLLNSQEESQKIIWSCSDSSDYENTHNEINVKAIKRKRKQVKDKKKITNISNLDVTFVDVTLEKKKENVQELRDYSNIEYVSNISNVRCTSPILNSQRYLAPLKTKTSTVISLSPCDHKENEPSSPVLVLKHNAPKFSPKVRKKLFNNNRNTNQDSCRENRSLSPVLNRTENRLRKSSNYQNGTINENPIQTRDTCQRNTITKSKEEHECDSSISKVLHIYKNKEIPLKCQEEQIYRNNIHLDDTLTDKTKSVVLVEKVKSYFDSYFSSTANSQHSISEYESKSSPMSNDDIEIISSLPETKNTQSLMSDNRSSSDSFKYFDNIPQTTKKVKYKKDGLAYRLSALIKKQNASTSLWYHERFLAANSNFVLPQEQFMALRIQEVSYKYNCYLLKALNINDENCIILINNLYAKNVIIQENCVLKLYKPYKIIEFEDYKLIINVCKYECVILKH